MTKKMYLGDISLISYVYKYTYFLLVTREMKHVIKQQIYQMNENVSTSG